MANVTMPNGDVVAFPDDMPKAQIRSLIEKKFPDAQRRAQAKSGEKPYMTDLEGAVTAVTNLPAQIQRSVIDDLGMMAAEAVTQTIAPQVSRGMTPPLKVTPGEPIADLLNQPAAAAYDVKGTGIAQGLPDGTVSPVNLAALIPKEITDPIARAAALTSLRQQLNSAETAKRITPLDMNPDSLGGVLAGAAANIVDTIAPAAVSLIIRNPAPFISYFTARVLGESYGEARRQGAGADRAQAAAGLKAAAEAAASALAGKVFVEGGKTLLGTVLKNAGVEGLTEAATEALQALVDVGVLEQDMTLEEARSRVTDAGLIGAITGSVVSGATYPLRSKPTSGIELVEPQVAVPDEPNDTPIEDRIGLPGPEKLLALPSPEQFRTPDLPRRQPDAPRREEPKPPTEDQIDYQAQIALQRTKQVETAELFQTARETITPLGTFSVDEIGQAAAGKVRQHRIQMGRPVEAPVTIEDMARAKVPQPQIDAVIAQRRPVTSETPLTALDIMRAADAKNIIPTDTNFSELALRATGKRDVQSMSQAQLNALKTWLDAQPAHPTPVTVPLAEQSPFTDDQYGKALDAVRQQGRYTAAAIKEATGLKATKDVDAVRDAMVRRGQLVERGKGDYRLYDTLGVERQSVPDDLPPGAFKEYTARRVPVSKLRVTKDGKSVGIFSSATQARETVSKIREKDRASAVAIEPAADTAWGVMENRYDEQGNLLGSVVVDSYRDEADAQKALERLNAPPDTGARYTQTDVTPPPSAAPGAAPTQRPPMPPAFAGRLSDIVKRLNAQARDRKLPLLGVRVQLKPEITGPDGAPIEGFYLRKVISLATQYLSPGMSTDQIVESLARVMDHETIHALRAAGVLSPETDGWKTIVRYTRRAKRPDSTETYFDWAQRNYGRPGNPDGPLPGYETRDSIEEEAIAEAFRAWASNRRNVAGKPATVFRQIVEWFKRLLNAVPEDAFRAIETGTMVSEALTPRGSDMTRARETQKMESAAAEISEAQKVRDENLVQVKSREYLRAREQARDDRFGRSGPKTVLGTTPTKAYSTGDVGDTTLARSFADKYRQENGVEGGRLMTLLPVDAGYMIRIADAQQRGVHAPGDAAVAKAYRALINETKRMYQALGDLEVTAWTAAGAPYDSPASMLGDIASGKLTMRLSDDTFGPGADNPGHPLNAASGYKTTDGRALTNNDIFRVVHDVYGHGQSGFVSDERGSYNAYHEHARLLSPEARRALATETLAQDAWHRFGPHLRRSDGTVPRGRVVGEGANAQVIGDVDYLADKYKEFAEQKAFLLDEEVVGADPGWALAEKASGVEDLPKFSLPDNRIERDARPSEIGKGYGDYVTYTDKNTGAYLQVVERTGAARDVSVISFEVPEEQRGKGVGRALFGYVLKQHPSLMGQVSSKAAAKIAYDAGRRPWGEPDATLDDVMRKIEEDSSVNLLTDVSRFDDNLPGGRLYGNPNRSPGGALSAPGTPTPAFTSDRPGNQFFGGELADEQLRMAREGDRGTTMIYMSPEDFLVMASAETNPEQEVYNAAIEAGYKLSGLPSLVTSGYAGNVRAVAGDSTAGAAALVGRADAIPVLLYPKDGQSLGLVTALEAPDGSRLPWPHEGRAENFPEVRGPRYSVGSPEFRRWFGGSKVVGEDGKPLVVYHGTGATETFNEFKESRPAFFTPDQSYAEGYTDKGGGKPRVISAFLAIERPFDPASDPDATQVFNEEFLAYLTQRFPRRAAEFKPLAEGQPLSFVDADLVYPFLRRRAEENPDSYDGMVVHEGGIDKFEGVASPYSWAPLTNTQIKSAVANRGTYDVADPDIRYSLNAPFGTRVPNGPHPTPTQVNTQQTLDRVGEMMMRVGRSQKEFIPIPGYGMTSIYETRIKTQDSFLSVLELVEFARRNDIYVDALNNPYQAEMLYHGKLQERLREADVKLYMPLIEALDVAGRGPSKITPKDLGLYLYAMHAPERNADLRAAGSPEANPSGMSDARASSILDQFAIDGKLPELERLGAMARRIIDDVTTVRVKGGLLSEGVTSPYTSYVTLGVPEVDPEPGSALEGMSSPRSPKGFAIGGKEDKSATGRYSEADAEVIIAALIAQHSNAIIRAEANEVSLAAARLVQDTQKLGMGNILSIAPTRRVRGANGMIHEAGDPSYRDRPDVFTAKWKGQEIAVKIDPRIARALKRDYGSVTQPLVRFLINSAGWWTRLQAMLNVGWSPEFMAINAFRGMIESQILSGSYDIQGMAKDMRKNYRKAANGIHAVLREGGRDRAAFEKFQALYGGGKDTEYWVGMFDEMRKAGGTTGMVGMHTLEDTARKIQRHITQAGWKSTPRKAANMLRNVGDFIEGYNNWTENIVRLTAYEAGRRAGMPPADAAVVAKTMGPNFNKGGEWKGTLNSAYLFFNAALQGSTRIIQGLVHPRMRWVVGGIVLAGFAQDILNRIGGDEDDNENGIPDYDEIPDYVLRNNIVIMDRFGVLESVGVKKGYLAIPMPLGFNAFYNIGRNMSAAFSGSPVRSVGSSLIDIGATFADMYNPMGGAEDISNFVAPTIMDPFVDLWRNKDYAGNTIVPDRMDVGGVPTPDSQKYWSNTGPVPVQIAEWLNNLGGGDEVRKGSIAGVSTDISPEAIQFWYDYATGSVGKFAERVIGLGVNVVRQDLVDVEIGDIPFARRMAGSVGNRGNTELYYETAKEVATVAKQIKTFSEGSRPEDIDRVRRIVAEKPVEVRLIKLFEDVQKGLQDLRKKLRDVRDNTAIPEARRKEIEKQIKEQQDALMARANATYFEQKRAAQ